MSAPRSISLLLAIVFGPAVARAEAVQVLDVMILGESRVAGQKVGEFSALVFDPARQTLLAISDRGYIATLSVDLSGDRLARVDVTALQVLLGPDSAPMPKGTSNPEAAAMLPDGTVAIVDEAAARLAVFDASGQWLRDEALPAAVSDVTLQASDKDGIEALAWTPVTGFVAMTEEPQLGQPRHLHTVHTVQAGAWAIDMTGPESVSIKAMESVGDQFFLLERTRDNQTDALTPYLRILDRTECQAAATCTGRRLSIDLGDMVDADFEGLAHLGNGRFLMVSDDKIDGDLRSVFVLFSLP
ncbi:MAG: esterase-like activity of phytase family protein [Rhodobacteraceae bacterium]|nr:esterase-like activity of phytase family protein [Paracoccaceae bacterium]